MNSSQPQQTLKDKVFLITGAAGGFGAALADRLMAAGAEPVLLDRDRRGLEQLHDELQAEHGRYPGLYPLDLIGAGPEEFSACVDLIMQEFRALHGVIHAAARFDGLTPLEHVRPDHWLAMVQTNLNAPWALTRASLPALREASRAALVLVTEDPAVSRSPYRNAYGASKAALESLAAQWAEELANTDILVTAFNPGPMRTSLRATAYHAEDPNSVPLPAVAAERLTTLLAAHFAEG